MPRPARWQDLHGGVISLAAVVALALSILFFGNVNSLHGSTIRLYAAVGSARGVLRGTEVWLYGRKVGLVDGVSFLPSSSDSVRRLIVAMNVLDRYRENIRTDAAVQIRSGSTLIGAPVVYIKSGSAHTRPVNDGDTILAVPQNDFEMVTSQFAVASQQFPGILSNLKIISQHLSSAEGTLGALGVERGGPQLDAAQIQLRRLGQRLDARQGTIGLAFNGKQPLLSRAQRALARADSLRTLASSGTAVLGRFRTDTTFATQVRDARTELSIVRALMQSPNGNLGRFGSDSAVFRSVTDAERQMSLLFADVMRHPMRYLHF
jgi:MlaD protein